MAMEMYYLGLHQETSFVYIKIQKLYITHIRISPRLCSLSIMELPSGGL